MIRVIGLVDTMSRCFAFSSSLVLVTVSHGDVLSERVLCCWDVELAIVLYGVGCCYNSS